MKLLRVVRSRRFRFALLLVAVAAVLFAAGVASACPTCKDGVAANDPEHAHMVKGYFFSILFMMGMPYLLLASFCLYMYFEVRKARARDAAKAADAVPKKPLAPATAAAPEKTADKRELVEV
jgi:uncharacterized membrane protein